MVKRLTKLPHLTGAQWRLLALVTLAAGFSSYSVALLPLALTQIQRGLAIPAEQLGEISAIIRLGAAPAFLFALSADRFGRRRLLLLAITAYLLLSGLTAFAPTPVFFMLAQFGVRLFAAVAGILAQVMIIEEFPDQARGWGIGAYSALASVGGGCAALLFAFVDRLPLGWRTLYLVAWTGLLLVGLWRTYLPETTRFAQQHTSQSATLARRQWAAPLANLVHRYPGRFVVVGLIVLLFNLGGDPALFYDPTYLQQQHGWQPWQIAALNLGAGFMALVGSMVAGRVSDWGGRKRATSVFLVGMPFFIIAYYTADGWRLPLFWSGLLFTSIGVTVTLSALGSELFPTTYRSTATGVLALIATVSGATSLLLHDALRQTVGSPWLAVNWLALLILLTPPFLLLLPETSGRSLEEIAPP